ncbi:antitermination protein [Shigella sonnei]|nr:antitermination protein [Shigella sonnei]EJF7794050.1 antitermination protein [Shigella sonnei]HCR6786359.1 antitermination protein [Shigella sonnei]
MTNQITRASWEKTVKKFYDALVTRFDIEEAWAERQLKKVTRLIFPESVVNSS